MVLLEFSMAPLEKGASVGEYVARSLKIIDESGLDYRLHAMGTIVEGRDRRCAGGAEKVSGGDGGGLRADHLHGKARLSPGTFRPAECKVASVEEKLGRPLKKVE